MSGKLMDILAPAVLTRSELDNMGCAAGCEHRGHEEIYLHGHCHPSAGTRASYDRNTGVLLIACRSCRKPITRLLVAAELPS